MIYMNTVLSQAGYRIAGRRGSHVCSSGNIEYLFLSGRPAGAADYPFLLHESPPAAASEKDDGYLSASEIARLKLDADWVILSACNTAAVSLPVPAPMSATTGSAPAGSSIHRTASTG